MALGRESRVFWRNLHKEDISESCEAMVQSLNIEIELDKKDTAWVKPSMDAPRERLSRAKRVAGPPRPPN